MGCGVSTTAKDGKVSGCQSSGGCSTGGCNRHNTFDWFAGYPISFNEQFNIIEVSFKQGARKGFYKNTAGLDLHKGQLVVVEAVQGYDVGEVSLKGELVKAQMKKRKITERDDTIRNVLGVAGEEDINVLLDARNKENEILVRARAMAHIAKMEMKIGDVEFQGDGKKVTIYYTAENRIDFRELVKNYARDFKVKIEMRQIGARQEAARLGGVGSCGRELCCSTWLHDFKTVGTGAVRYQNLAINTDKLSGQCGRLKCCLNYELDTYNDLLKNLPKRADKIETEEGTAYLMKTEILKQVMWYAYDGQRNNPFKLSPEAVKEMIAMNKAGQKAKSLGHFSVVEKVVVDESKHDDLVGQVSLTALEDKARKQRNQAKREKEKQKFRANKATGTQQQGTQQKPPQQKQQGPKQQGQQNQNRPPQGKQGPKPGNQNRPPQNKGPKPPSNKPPQNKPPEK